MVLSLATVVNEGKDAIDENKECGGKGVLNMGLVSGHQLIKNHENGYECMHDEILQTPDTICENEMMNFDDDDDDDDEFWKRIKS
jgi:hypothetical protein